MIIKTASPYSVCLACLNLHELYLNLLLRTVTFIILLVPTFNMFIYFSSVNTTLNYYVAKANEAHTCTCNYHPKALERK